MTVLCPSSATMKSRYWTDQNWLDISKVGAQTSSVLTEIIQIHSAWSQTWPFLVSDDWSQTHLFDRKVSCQQANKQTGPVWVPGCTAVTENVQEVIFQYLCSAQTRQVGQPNQTVANSWAELHAYGHIAVALNSLFINDFIKMLSW